MGRKDDERGLRIIREVEEKLRREGHCLTVKKIIIIIAVSFGYTSFFYVTGPIIVDLVGPVLGCLFFVTLSLAFILKTVNALA